jgi:hypothetical protein
MRFAEGMKMSGRRKKLVSRRRNGKKFRLVSKRRLRELEKFVNTKNDPQKRLGRVFAQWGLSFRMINQASRLW